jgi:hypothetical protein
MLTQQIRIMATLRELVTTVSAATGVPESTVFAYGRFARQAGLLSQKGRGRQAAAMTLQDAANLLIALGGTSVTRDAGSAISTFRPLQGRVYDFSGSMAPQFSKWLEPLRPRLVARDEFGDDRQLEADLGHAIEFLIESTVNGSLAQFFSTMPVAEIPSELSKQWKRSNSIHLEQSLDYLIEQGLVKPKAPQELEFGEDISLEINFSRVVPSVDIEFRRMWDAADTAFVLSFGPGAHGSRPHDLRLVATITQHTLAAIGLVLNGSARPSAIRSLKPINALFAEQFRSLSSTFQDHHNKHSSIPGD